MFATLLGGLPRPPLREAATSAELVAAGVAAQSQAGLEPLVDGGLWGGQELRTVVERWRATADLTDPGGTAKTCFVFRRNPGDRALFNVNYLDFNGSGVSRP